MGRKWMALPALALVLASAACISIKHQRVSSTPYTYGCNIGTINGKPAVMCAACALCPAGSKKGCYAQEQDGLFYRCKR